jgi:hypothetical protein
MPPERGLTAPVDGCQKPRVFAAEWGQQVAARVIVD